MPPANSSFTTSQSSETQTLVDQAEFPCIVRIFDSYADRLVAESEHYSLKYPTVVVVDGDHLAPSWLESARAASAWRTSAVLVERASRWH